MVSLAQCRAILADHPKVHSQSLAAREYKRLGPGLASLPFLDLNAPEPNDEQLWDYQKFWSPDNQPQIPVHRSSVPFRAAPSVAANPVGHLIQVDKHSSPPPIHRFDGNVPIHRLDGNVEANAKGQGNSQRSQSSRAGQDKPLPLPPPSGPPPVDHQRTEDDADEYMIAQIQALGLRGLKALSYIFISRHGSLEAAFEYMDANRSGQVSLNAWITCLLVMHAHPELEKLVGVTPQEIFAKIDTHNSSTISRSEFLAFFQSVQRGVQKGARKGKAPAAESTSPSKKGVQRSPKADEFGLKAIEDEEANLLAALGSLDDQLVSGDAQEDSARNAGRDRHGRPPRPKPLKVR